MELGLAGRTCAVTGASRGIGREVARQLCEEGANVLLIARNEDALAEATEEVAGAGKGIGGRAEHLTLDVTDDSAGDHILAATEQDFGALDVLVNNAGSARWRTIEEVPVEDWRVAYELNVIAPLRAMLAT